MEIHSLTIENYKHFQHFSGEFGIRDEEISPFSIRFIIGNNGSGKTSIMQAIGLIFTRALNDESPGFKYELIYSVVRGTKKTFVLLSNDVDKYKLTDRLHIRITENGLDGVKNGSVVSERFSEQVDLHPRRVISFASGPNNSLQEVLVNSPLGAINSDIYDFRERLGGDSGQLGYLQQLRGKMLYEPNCLNFEPDNASLILAALLLAAPLNEAERSSQFNKKMILFRMVKKIKPLYVSFELDERKCREIEKSLKNKLRYERLFLDFISRQPNEERQVKVVFSKDRIIPKAVRVITFDEQDHLSSNPTEFLTMLLTAHNMGYLLEAHIFFKHEDTDQLLDQKSLSDGEFLWLCRMALVILSQQEHDENTLFLFDEPDVFLNESWTMRFINLLHDFVRLKDDSNGTSRYNRQEYWIATHSTLVLTDAFPEQTFIIKESEEVKGHFEASPLTSPTFGADRGEVSAQLFMDQRIGEFSKQFIDEKLDINNRDHYSPDHMRRIVGKIGPGYQRFRIEEYLQHIKVSKNDKYD
ncbi:AAA family ATPase [Paenibacillus taichungensis]|uniref:AAA family ATPase n=1 Tax=Paenibacillus taichungensis TaxID=484184 RepID=UPI0038D0A53D